MGCSLLEGKILLKKRCGHSQECPSRLDDPWTVPGRAQGPSASPSGGWSSCSQPQFGLTPKMGVDLDKSAQSPCVQHTVLLTFMHTRPSRTQGAREIFTAQTTLHMQLSGNADTRKSNAFTSQSNPPNLALHFLNRVPETALPQLGDEGRRPRQT